MTYFSEEAATLLQLYSFDLAGYSTDQLVAGWEQIYSERWIRSAVIEALYQGRYKAVSVEKILVVWLRRGQPLRHFNHEFEKIVCNQSDCKPIRNNYPQRSLSEPLLSSTDAPNLTNQNSDPIQTTSHSDNSDGETDPLTQSPPNLIEQQIERSNEHTQTSLKSEKQSLAVDPTQPPSSTQVFALKKLPISNTLQSSYGYDDKVEIPDSLRQMPHSTQSINTLVAQEPGQPDKSDIENGKKKHSIHQFKPASEPSEFYFKLRAVAQLPDTSIQPS
ncbi:MAG: hypothetical protein QNJ46_08720 [Leptolyngbyaceae cyanobacterium MO_188.B28]|nr:hypothetical protein [Leptolyngbyaceae cyanobacterium MO_188.B28]